MNVPIALIDKYTRSVEYIWQLGFMTGRTGLAALGSGLEQRIRFPFRMMGEQVGVHIRVGVRRPVLAHCDLGRAMKDARF